MQTMIITGAASGLGKALALHFKNNELILIDKEAKPLKALAKSIDANYYVCDLAIANEVESLIKKINKQYPHIDILINNAGRWISGHMSEKDDEKFAHMHTLENIQHVLNSNIFGAIALINKLVDKLDNGLIININSQSGVNVEEPFPIYNASKQAMKAFRKAIQNDLVKANIRISDIYPGLINTEFYDNANTPIPKDILETGLSTDEIIKSIDFILSLPKDVMIPALEILKI